MKHLTSFHRVLSAFGLVLLQFALPPSAAAQVASMLRPTIVLVHGAFAESASWNDVAKRLRARHFAVIAVANPLRGLASDATYVAAVTASIPGPVVLVGHSYGGAVISAAATASPNVKGLVFVAAFAPEAGESALLLSNKFPGGTLGQALAPAVPLADGGKDLSIQQDKFHDQFAADVPRAVAELMAVSQRPVTEAALGEAAGAPAWKQIPSWFIYGDADRNIPPAAQAFMAQRAGARETVVVKGGSHVVMVSNPARVTSLIVDAARQASPKP